MTKRGDYYNNHRQNKIRGKTAHVRKTRSPASPSVHDPPDLDLIHEINTTQEPRGTPTKVTADTVHTPTQQQGRLKKQFIHSAIIITSMEYHTDFHPSGFLH